MMLRYFSSLCKFLSFLGIIIQNSHLNVLAVAKYVLNQSAGHRNYNLNHFDSRPFLQIILTILNQFELILSEIDLIIPHGLIIQIIAVD